MVTESQSEAENLMEKEAHEKEEINNASLPIKESLESVAFPYDGEAEEEDTIYSLENNYETDTESVQYEEPEYVRRKFFTPPADFFKIFSQIPDVDNISVDASMESIAIEQTHTSEVNLRMSSKGAVETALEISDELIASKSDIQHQLRDVTDDDLEAKGSVKDESSADVSKLHLPDASLYHENEKITALEDTTLQAFLEFQKEPESLKTTEIDWKSLVRLEENEQLVQNTTNFLTDLIDKVVEIAEYLTPERVMQQNLDKRKLLSELVERLQNYYAEKGKCIFLNRQAVTHFRRKKHFRVIMEDDPKTLLRDKKNLEKAKEYLDKILAKETKLVTRSTQVQKDLRDQYNKLKAEAETQILMFETKVKNQLRRDSWPKLNAEIDRLLLAMKTLRQDVSEVRFALLLQQHTEAKLMDFIERMEDLGHGLNMKTFITLQAENQTLDSKIEERNIDLDKLYLRCHKTLHTLAHYKENQNVLHESVKLRRKILKNLTNEMLILRGHLFSLKLQRNQIHGKMKKLSVEGGLLDKPALMLDYDHTMQLIGDKQQSVDYLKQTLSLTQEKIDQILKYCGHVKK